MFWLYNNDSTYSFYQIFENSNLVWESNLDTIYCFDNNLTELNKKIKSPNFQSYPVESVDIIVKSIDQIIEYIRLDNNKNWVFSYKTNFIKPSDNDLSLPIFNFNYKLVDSHRMPNLIETAYNWIYRLNMSVYTIDSNSLYIIENNLITKQIKKYWVVKNLNTTKNFLV